MSQPKEIPDIREGPIKKRECTDVFFAFVFLVFLFALVLVGTYGYYNGDPELLLHPFDSSGNQCGRNVYNTSDYRYLYVANPNDTLRLTVCVQTCPDSNSESLSCFDNYWVTCNGGNVIYRDTNNTDNLISSYVYATDTFMDRVCLPKDKTNNTILEKIESANFYSFEADIVRTWDLILIVLGIAVFISLLYLFTVRYFLQCALWGSLVFIVTLFITFGYFLMNRAESNFSSEGHEKTRVLLWASAIVCYLFGLFFLITFVCIKERIDLAIAIIKSSVIFIGDV